MAENPYKVLGVADTATPAQIKQAYRHRALQCHPDAVGAGREAEFLKISEAYEALSGRSPREEKIIVRAGPARRPPSRRYAGGAFSASPTARLELLLDPEEAATGLNLSIGMDFAVPCPVCEGMGLFSLWCPICGGRGAIHQPARVCVCVPAGIGEGEVIRASGFARGVGPIVCDLQVSIAGR